MKTKSANSIKLGVFVTIATLLFVVALFFIGQKKRMFSNTFKISGVFKDVSGLQVGNNIRFSGINVGVIESINIISDTSVRVDMVIEDDIKKFIKKDAIASIGSEGLMGSKLINISSGTAGTGIIENNDFVKTVMPISMDKIMSQLSITSENAAYITDDLAAITSSVKNGKGTIGRLFMDSVLANNLNKTIRNLKGSSKSLEENMEAAKHSFFLRGAFKRKEREKEEKLKEKEEKREEKEKKR